MKLENKIPEGPLENKWTNYKSKVPLVVLTSIDITSSVFTGEIAAF